MPARRQLLQKITLTADVLSVTFSNIPQNYTDLVVLASARSSRTGTSWVTPSITFNAASNSTDYSGIVLRGDGSSASSFGAVSAGYNGIAFGVCPSAGITANTFDNIQVTIPNYTSSTQKSILAVSGSENNGTTGFNQVVGGRWTGTAAITSLTVWANGNVGGHAYTVGSTFYLYGLTQVPVIVGGTETISGGYKIHTFTATSSLRVVEAGQVEYLVVAGGGGAANSARFAGGGGGGGLLNARAFLSPGNVAVTVGAGGTASATVAACKGSDSSIGSVTAVGGGGGSAESLTPGTGGSGGGGNGATTGQAGASGTSGQGNSGGAGSASVRTAGGGGGAGGAGSAGATAGGNGGAGAAVFGALYGGGGGGSAYEFSDGVGEGGAGGSGGGGGGGRFRTAAGTASYNAVSGLANTGGGGGGGAWQGNGSNSASGGSGVVIIRYPYISN